MKKLHTRVSLGTDRPRRLLLALLVLAACFWLNDAIALAAEQPMAEAVANTYSWVFPTLINLALWCGIIFAAYRFWSKNRREKTMEKILVTGTPDPKGKDTDDATAETKTKERLSATVKALIVMGAVFVGALAVLIIKYGHLLLNSDLVATDTIVQALQTEGLAGLRSYVAQQNFWQLEFIVWLPKLLITSIVRETILSDKITILVHYFALLAVLFAIEKKIAGKNAGWIAATVLAGGLSWVWFVCSGFELIYSAHLMHMLVFLLLGFSLAMDIEKKWRKKERMLAIAFAVYTLYIISMDQRYAGMYSVPFCAALILTSYVQCYRSERIREINRALVWNNIKILGIVAVCTGAGFFINHRLREVFPFSARLSDYSAFAFADFSSFFDTLTNYFICILNLWGVHFSTGVSTISAVSVMELIKTAACIGCMAVIPVLCAAQFKKLPSGIRYLLVFYFVLSAELFYIYGMSALNTYRIQRYYVYSIVLSIMIGAWFVYEKMIAPGNLNRYIAAAAVLAVGATSLYNISNCLSETGKTGDYDSREELIAYLTENDLDYGYASYWNAQIITSMSDTEVKVLPVILGNSINPFYDLNIIDHFSADNHAGRSFILLTNEEYATLCENASDPLEEAGAPQEKLNHGNWTILIYDHNVAEDFSSFPYNGAYTPFHGKYEVVNEVFSAAKMSIEATGDVDVKAFDVRIQPDTLYRISFTAETSQKTELFYVDFSGENYELGQLAWFSIEPGTASYEAVIPSGKMKNVDPQNMAFRIVSILTSPLEITDFRLEEVRANRY